MRRVSDLHHRWENFAFSDLTHIFGPGKTVILSPHQDDESLGCGGAIALLCQAGPPPMIIFITDGAGSHPSSASTPPAALRSLREAEAREALHRLGHHDDSAVAFLRLPDTATPISGPGFDTAVERILTLAHDCATICAPWRHDPHHDHQATDRMARAAATHAGWRHISYPVWGWTLPPDTELDDSSTNGWRLDISPVLPSKRHAIAAHRSQLGLIITDDPNGFELPSDLIHIFQRPFEVYSRQ